MNLYLLFAIALGAITGTTEAPAARPRLANVTAECGVITNEQSIASPRSSRQSRAF